MRLVLLISLCEGLKWSNTSIPLNKQERKRAKLDYRLENSAKKNWPAYDPTSVTNDGIERNFKDIFNPDCKHPAVQTGG